MLDIEVFDLVVSFVGSHYIQEFSQTVLLQVFLGQVLQISFRKWNVSLDFDFSFIIGNLDVFPEFAKFAIDFDALFKELRKVIGVEYFIFDWFGAVDTKNMVVLLVSFVHGWNYFN